MTEQEWISEELPKLLALDNADPLVLIAKRNTISDWISAWRRGRTGPWTAIGVIAAIQESMR